MLVTTSSAWRFRMSDYEIYLTPNLITAFLSLPCFLSISVFMVATLCLNPHIVAFNSQSPVRCVAKTFRIQGTCSLHTPDPTDVGYWTKTYCYTCMPHWPI